MHFKYAVTARGVRLDERGLPARFRAGRTTVTLRLPDPEEQDQGFTRDNALCDAHFALEPNPKVAEALGALAEGRLPPDSERREEWGREYDYIDEHGRLRENYVAPWPVLPQRLRDFLTQTSKELTTAIRTVVGVLRWRLGDEGHHEPLSSRGLFFSLDGETWHHAPRQTSLYVTTVGRLRVTDDVAASVQHLLDAEEEEPLAHALWREAWEQRHTNPRSAMLLGVAALEVGVKHFISAAVPEATWLVQEAPSPPIEAILVHYLPSLPAGGESPGDDAIRVVRKAIHVRNRLVHSGCSNFTYETLETSLVAVRALLWKLDADRGFGWAKDHRDAT
ncbi:MAG: hypothetical protein JWN65_398 [Solirubrobacterales bacterium]|nr:hypothetical protein [Solirubrobacterales bacterium]